MASNDNEFLDDNPLLLLDGGLGTTLELPPYNVVFSSRHTPLWSSHLLVADPETLRAVHASFVRGAGAAAAAGAGVGAGAGADVVLTATYQASFEGFVLTRPPGGVGGDASDATADGEGNGVGKGIGEEEARKYMRAAVRLARDAFGTVTVTPTAASTAQTVPPPPPRKGVVALSLGAYGATLIPGAEYSGAYGDGPREGLEGWHRRRLEVFSEHPETWGEVDVVAFETLPRLDEVRAVRGVMSSLELEGSVAGSKNKPWWVCCVFPGDGDDGQNGSGRNTLPDGSTVEEVVRAMLGGDDKSSRPWGIGLNCTKIWKVRGLIAEFEKAVEAGGYEWPRLVLYPDGAGDLVYDTVTQEWKKREQGQSSGGGLREDKSWDQEMAEIVDEVQRGRGRWKGIVVGGCCKTGPEHIGALGRRLKGDRKL